VSDNEIEGNKVGIKGSTTARLDFAGNDFSGQTPRLLDGELVQFAAKFFDFSANGAPLTIEGLTLAARPLPAAAAARPQSCRYPQGV
jgi:poly(beta-D-mannuronate) C5 epimerase